MNPRRLNHKGVQRMTASAFMDAARATLCGVPDIIEPGMLYRLPTNGHRGVTSGLTQLFVGAPHPGISPTRSRWQRRAPR